MGTFRFGKAETTTCIVDVDVPVGGGEAVCLAHKTTSYWAFAGVWLTDDGYVLKPRNKEGYYYPLSGNDLVELEGLPHPLPHYSIAVSEYVGAFSLWWIVGLVLLWALAVKLVRKRKQASFAAQQGATPIDRGPPRLDTDGDRFVYESAKIVLLPGESIEHQAFATSWDYTNDKEGDDAFFLVLTSKRLLRVKTRRSAFGIRFENDEIDAFDRVAVEAAEVAHGNVLFVSTNDGLQRGYVVKSSRKLSNQRAFLMNAGRLLSSKVPASRPSLRQVA